MKPIQLKLLGTLAVCLALILCFSTAHAQPVIFTNPTPAADDHFGDSLAAVGTDRVLIGAPLDDTGATGAGAAYLFGTDGALLTNFTNPAPATFDYFGNCVAALRD